MTASESRASDPVASTEPTPLDRLLELAVYVPVGLALAARDVLPQLAEAGRRQLTAQFTAARVVGRLAVDQGTRQAGKTIRRLAEEGGAALKSARRTEESGPRPGGPFPAPEPAPTGRAEPSPMAEPSPVADVPGGPAPPDVRLSAVPDAPESAVASASEPAADVAPDLDPAELAIPGYDTLSASQVVQRLPGLSPAELEAVRSYEQAGRGRKTILLKIAQLRSTS